MRFELNTFSRVGDLLDEDNKLVKRVSIGLGLSESDCVESWENSVIDAMLSEGFEVCCMPEVSLPLTKENAIERFTIRLEHI